MITLFDKGMRPAAVTFRQTGGACMPHALQWSHASSPQCSHNFTAIDARSSSPATGDRLVQLVYEALDAGFPCPLYNTIFCNC